MPNERKINFFMGIIEKIKAKISAKTFAEQKGILVRSKKNKKRYQCPQCNSSDGLDISHEEYFLCWAGCAPPGKKAARLDVIDLAQSFWNCNKATAIKNLAHELGIEKDIFFARSKPAPKLHPAETNQSKKSDVKVSHEWQQILELAETPQIEELTKWLTARNFGKHLPNALKWAENCNIRIYHNHLYKVANLVFPTINDYGTIVGCHLFDMPDGKKFKGLASGSNGSSVYPIIVNPQSDHIIIVEAVVNAFSLASAGVNTIACFSKNNLLAAINIAKKLYHDKRIAAWLDHDAATYQKNIGRTHGIEFITWDRRQITQLCNQLPEKERKKKIEGFDQNDLLALANEQFSDIVGEYLKQLRPIKKNVLSLLGGQTVIVPFIQNAITREKHIMNVVIAYTGIGKTHYVCQLIKKHLLNKDDSVTFFADTVNNAENAWEKVGYHKDIAKIISNALPEDTQEKRSKKAVKSTEKAKRINFSTYGYLGTNGHKNSVYSVAGGYTIVNTDNGMLELKEGLTTKVFIYCDELHQLFQYAKIVHPLRQVYILKEINNDVWYETSNDYQNWQRYYFGYQTIMKNYNKFSYHETIQAEGLQRMTSVKELPEPLGNFEFLANPKNYKQVIGTLFCLVVEQTKNISTEIPFNEDNKTKLTEYDYLKTLLKYLHSPKIFCQFPVLKETNEAVTQVQIDELFKKFYIDAMEKRKAEHPTNEDKAKELATQDAREKVNSLIIRPQSAAYVPILEGYDLLRFIQVLKHTEVFNGLSATITPDKKKMLADICKLVGWKFRETIVTEVPFVWNIRAIKIEKEISLEKQAKIVAQLEKKSSGRVKTLVVVWKKANAKTVYTRAKKHGAKDVALFVERDYETRYIDKISGKGNIVTYPGAGVLQGENMPDQNNILIDVGIFIARLGLDLQVSKMTRQEIMWKLADYIQDELTQIIGRILRATEEENKARKQGEKKIAKKLITIIFHNIPKELWNFMIDGNLTNTYEEYFDNGNYSPVSAIESKQVESIVDAILKLQEGQTPINQKELETKELAKKKFKEIDKKQRLELKESGVYQQHKEENKEKKLEKKYQECLEMYKNGISYKEIYIKNHLGRYQEIKEKVIQLFKKQ